jgi:hypothetical protein
MDPNALSLFKSHERRREEYAGAAEERAERVAGVQAGQA